MSFVSTLAAFGMTPLCLWIFYQTRYDAATDVEVPYVTIMGILVIVVIGVGTGLAVRRWQPGSAELVSKVAAGISVIFIIAAFVFGVMKDTHILESDFRVWLFSLLVQPLGYAGGLLFSILAQQSWQDAMTICLETGIQNFALAMAIVGLSVDENADTFKDASRIPLLCAMLYPIHSVWIVLVLRQFPPETTAGEQKEEPIQTSATEDGIELEVTCKDDSGMDAEEERACSGAAGMSP